MQKSAGDKVPLYGFMFPYTSRFASALHEYKPASRCILLYDINCYAFVSQFLYVFKASR